MLLIAFTVCAQDFSKAKELTEELFYEELKNEEVHNAFLSVYSPSKNIDWNFADGTFRNGNRVKLSHPFHTASIGKTFTATAITLLHDQGKLNISDRIGNYLHDSIMNGLHVFKGIDYSEEITIAQLLQHTSGLPDYFEGETIDGSPNGMGHLFIDIEKQWKPIEMIRLAKEKMKPHFVPGSDYHYTDTEYILLGLIVENISGMSLHDFFHAHLFRPLEMNHTYMHLRSDPIATMDNMSELFVADFDASSVKSLSLDWAGGGLATTAQDLNIFQEALHTDKILKPETLLQMQQWKSESQGFYYGYGIRKISLNELNPTWPDLQVLGHTGTTSSFMFYCPQLDVYLSGTLNQVTQMNKSVLIPAKVLTFIVSQKKN